MIIATIGITVQNAAKKFLSREHLWRSKDDDNSPLSSIVMWFRDECSKDFDIHMLRIGRSSDDFAFLYYQNGVRYAVMKDGTAIVSGADSDNRFEGAADDLQSLVNSILTIETAKAIAKAINNDKAREREIQNQRGMMSSSSPVSFGSISIPYATSPRIVMDNGKLKHSIVGIVDNRTRQCRPFSVNESRLKGHMANHDE